MALLRDRFGIWDMTRKTSSMTATPAPSSAAPGNEWRSTMSQRPWNAIKYAKSYLVMGEYYPDEH